MNQSLPIAAFREDIEAAVAANAVTIVTAETGAGKSTQVPQYLLDAGYRLVVTEPRRLATRTVAERVAEEYGCRFGDTVGFRTARERRDNKNTRCLFCTDGLALVRELLGQGNRDVLVIDEVHEWNLNVEILVAWARQELENGADFKVVLMSATLEADRLSEYFDGAPVIDVPGRLHKIEKLDTGQSVESDAIRMLQAGRNVLVFQPGRAEIDASIEAIVRVVGTTAVVLPLYGDMSAEEQALCFQSYGKPLCVVATNVAQTSVTIPGIDAVVDSGMERRVQVSEDGVEGLYLLPISQADSLQRMGRAGRTKAGVYTDHCPEPWGERPEFPEAEIKRTRLDQTVLRLAEAGLDAEELRFFHQPDAAKIHEARQELYALGCMTESGKVTKVGHKVAKMPISVQYGRMIIEAQKHGVVGEVLTIAAILEMNGIVQRDELSWRYLCRGVNDSDVVAQLEVWRAAVQGKFSNQQLRDNGINAKSFRRAREVRKHLSDALHERGIIPRGEQTSQSNPKGLRLAIAAGMVTHLYRCTYTTCQNGDADYRQLSKHSVIPTSPEQSLLVGAPFDLSVPARFGGTNLLQLVTMATVVTPEMLMEVAPHLIQEEIPVAALYYDAVNDRLTGTRKLTLRGQVISEERGVPMGDQPNASEVFANWMVSLMTDFFPFRGEGALVDLLNANRSIVHEAYKLNLRAGKQVFAGMTFEELVLVVQQVLSGATCAADIPDIDEALSLPPLDASLVAKVMRENPDVIEFEGEKYGVSYTSDSPPKIPMSLEQAEFFLEELRLPGGRAVEVSVIARGGEVCSSDPEVVQQALKQAHAEYLWRDFYPKPTVRVPQRLTAETVLPGVVECTYGEYDGAPLVKYGVVEAIVDLDAPFLAVSWVDTREKAERIQAHAQEHVPAVRKAQEKQQAEEHARGEVYRAREELQSWNLGGFAQIKDTDLGREVITLLAEEVPSSLEQMKEHASACRIARDRARREIARIERDQRERAAKRIEIEDAVIRMGSPLLYIYVDGERRYLTCGWGSSNTMEGESTPLSVKVAGSSDWWEIPSSGVVKTLATSFSLPATGLSDGVWGYARDEDGGYFFPVNYYRGGEEVLPALETIQALDEPISENLFDLVRGRNYRCTACGGINTITKAESKTERVERSCDHCDTSGVIVNEEEPTVSPASEVPAASPAQPPRRSGGSTSLGDLIDETRAAGG